MTHTPPTHPRCPICGSEPVERTDNAPRDAETVWRFACDGMYIWASGPRGENLVVNQCPRLTKSA